MKSLSNPEIQRTLVQGGQSLIVRGAEWQVSGAGGKGSSKSGSSSSSATEDANTLRSQAYASLVYLISEGEIEGAATGDLTTSVFLDKTPLKNSNGSFNFLNFSGDFRVGLQNQAYIPGFPEISSPINVSTQLTIASGSITRTISDPNADAVVITVTTPQLQQIDADDGDQHGTSVQFKIEIQTNGGGYITVATPTISGKCTSSYQRSYRYALPKPGTVWQVRLTRLTADSSSNKLYNDLYWSTLTTVIDSKLNYPNSAMLALKLSSEQFNSIPDVGILLKGIKVKIPSNYNPITRQYFGAWDGTFGYAWTDNPAWILYDMLTESRYGCGRYIKESQVDKWSLYTIGQYCDQLVPNGFGGWEPRFTFNAYIQDADEVYTVINAIAASFRAMVYWAAGSVTVVQDSPVLLSTCPLISDANVIQAVDDNGQVTEPPFTYSGSSLKARHTVALVSWSDPDDYYKTKVEYVEDREGIALYGYRVTEVTAFGCTSRGQAHRYGRWILYTERFETEVVTFTMGTEGMLLRPGRVIKIADSNRAGARLSGRILAATTTSITLDAPTVIPPGVNTLSVLMPDGTPLDRQLTPGLTGTLTTITLAQALPSVPPAGTLWMLTTSTLAPQTFRVITVTEKSAYQYAITAIAHNPLKYAAIEQNLVLEPIPVSNLSSLTKAPEPPGAITVSESLFESGSAGVRVKADIGFGASPSIGIERYQIEYRLTGDPADFTVLGYTNDLSYAWSNVEPGIYTFRVCAFNKLGLKSAYTEITKQIAGLQKPPANVTNFTVTKAGDQALLSWDKHPDLDVQTGGFFIIKFTPKTSNFSWSDGFELPEVSGASSNCTAFIAAGTYMIKAIDSSGNASTNFTSVNTSGVVVQQTNIVQTLQESPNFPGAKTNCTVIAGILQLTSTSYFDSQSGLFDSKAGLFDAVSPDTFDSTPGLFDDQPGFFDNTNQVVDIVLNGVYEFSNTVNLGAAYQCRITANLSAKAASNRDFFDSKSGLFDDATGYFDGGEITGASATLQIQTSQDGVTFGAWSNFAIGDYFGRAFKFRLLLNSDSQNVNILVDQLSVTVDMPGRDEQGRVTSTGAIQTVSFSKAFWATSTPIVGITLINANQGDYFVLSNITNSGFQIQVFNASGTGISGRQFNWLARGFGQAI